ncbi:hypothetical protein Bca4012_014505 [Brassica carinata]
MISLSHVSSGPYGTFVGIYDGHGGPETSRFVNDHLLQHLKRFAAEQASMSMDVIRKAYEATEEEWFLGVVTKQWPVKPQIAAVGSCCLVGVICGGMLYIANVGDSRAVLGRAEMHSLHPDDSRIVVLKHNVWRVKGLIQLSNQEAVDIVRNHPRNGIGRRLVKMELQAEAKKREMRYSDLKKIERGVRRHFHDDITVVVIFIDTNVVSSSAQGSSLSIRGGGMTFPKKL